VRQLLGGLDVRESRGILQRLVRAGWLRQVGTKRGTRYVITEATLTRESAGPKNH